MGLLDGLPSREIISTTFSGANAQFTTGSFTDTATSTLAAGNASVGPAEIGSGNVLAANISGGVITNTHFVSGGILGPNISGGTITNSHMVANTLTAASHRIVGQGSPSVFGFSMQVGSAVATDVAVWAVFGTGFAAAPRVQMTLAQSGVVGTAAPMLGTVAAGSFSFLGQSGLIYHYLAVGSGAI